MAIVALTLRSLRRPGVTSSSVSWPSTVANWGSTAAERAGRFPCDPLNPAPDDVLFRAIGVEAPAEVTFRWLCQLRAAPYSYDKLDNLGRRSPQTLTPGLERLEVGQRFQTIFRLIEFEPGRSLTMLSQGRVFGRVACTYRADRLDEHRSRIVVKLTVVYPARLGRRLMHLLLPAGDLVMMRRQLLNLKGLAEKEARVAVA
jgi:hypothetical protein